jgi:hypothetical protein
MCGHHLLLLLLLLLLPVQRQRGVPAGGLEVRHLRVQDRGKHMQVQTGGDAGATSTHRCQARPAHSQRTPGTRTSTPHPARAHLVLELPLGRIQRAQLARLAPQRLDLCQHALPQPPGLVLLLLQPLQLRTQRLRRGGRVQAGGRLVSSAAGGCCGVRRRRRWRAWQLLVPAAHGSKAGSHSRGACSGLARRRHPLLVCLDPLRCGCRIQGARRLQRQHSS